MHQEKKQRKCHFYPVGLSSTGSGTLSLRHVWPFAGYLRVCGEESREDLEAAKVKILRLMQSASGEGKSKHMTGKQGPAR